MGQAWWPLGDAGLGPVLGILLMLLPSPCRTAFNLPTRLQSAVFDSQPKSTVGTPAYIAPEVLSRKQVRGVHTPLCMPCPAHASPYAWTEVGLSVPRACEVMPTCPPPLPSLAVRWRDCGCMELRRDAVRDAGGGVPI